MVGAIFVVSVIWSAAYLARLRPAETARQRPIAVRRGPAMPTMEEIADAPEATAEGELPIDAPPAAQASPETPKPEEKGGSHE